LRRGGRCAARAAVRHLDETLLTQKVVAIYESVLGRRAPSPRRSRCDRAPFLTDDA
jgi:hypothetical protein